MVDWRLFVLATGAKTGFRPIPLVTAAFALPCVAADLVGTAVPADSHAGRFHFFPHSYSVTTNQSMPASRPRCQEWTLLCCERTQRRTNQRVQCLLRSVKWRGLESLRIMECPPCAYSFGVLFCHYA
jgi:hypothetical protein